MHPCHTHLLIFQKSLCQHVIRPYPYPYPCPYLCLSMPHRFSFSTNSPCYCKVTLKQFKGKYLKCVCAGGGGGVVVRKWEKDLKFKIAILELYAFTLTFSLYAILLPGPILFSLSIQYEGIPRSSAISCRCEVLLEFHPPITNIRSNFSSTSLYIASWRSWQWSKLLN